MDTITAGNLAGLTIEADRQGRIDYQIEYGDTEAIAKPLRDIASRSGIGDILAQGIKITAKAGGWRIRPSMSKVWNLSDTILGC